MQFLAIDLENNQPSGSITQIGLVLFDTNSKQPVAAFSIWVDLPEGETFNDSYPLSSGGTLGDLMGEDWKRKWDIFKIPRKAAFSFLWTKVITKKIIQWGSGDLAALLEQSKAEGVYYPGRLTDLNLKKVYDMLYAPAKKLKGAGGLEAACSSAGVPFQGRPHDALVDAENTGRLFIKIFKDLEAMQKVKEILNGDVAISKANRSR